MILKGLRQSIESLDLLLVVVALMSMRRERLEFHDSGLEETWDSLSTDRQLTLVEDPGFLATYEVRTAGHPSLILITILATLLGFLAGDRLLEADPAGSLALGVFAAFLATMHGLRRRDRFQRAGDELARRMA